VTFKRSMIGSVALALSMAAGIAFGAATQPQVFAQTAAIAGMYEVQAAEMAVSKAKNEDVREFAQQMIMDHGQANTELKLLSGQRGWKLPTALDAKHQGLIDKLRSLEGEAFDREYATQQLAAHQGAVKLFQEQAKDGTDADLKKWADGKVPTLEQHLKHAQEMAPTDASKRG